MKAQVTREFRGVPDGQTQARVFHPGNEVCGDLARVAIGEGWAKALGAAPDNKALGGAPHNAAFPGAAAVAARNDGHRGDGTEPDGRAARGGTRKGKADRRQ